MKIPEELEKVIAEMSDAPPCFQVVGTGRSLRLGFGRIRSRILNNREIRRGEWEIGSYSGMWKIYLREELIVDCRNEVPTDVITSKVFELPWATVSGVSMISRIEVGFEFANEIRIVFRGENSDDDELCHIFYPTAMVAVYHPEKGWQFGPSNQPWQR